MNIRLYLIPLIPKRFQPHFYKYNLNEIIPIINDKYVTNLHMNFRSNELVNKGDIIGSIPYFDSELLIRSPVNGTFFLKKNKNIDLNYIYNDYFQLSFDKNISLNNFKKINIGYVVK